MSELTLTLRGLPPHTATALRSMLVLLDSALGARWRLMDAPIADVILVPGERMAEIRKAGSEVEVPLLLALTSDSVCPPGAFAVLKRPVTPAHLVEVLQLAEQLVERARASDEGILTVPLIESLDPGGRLAPQTFDARLRTTLRAATWRLFQSPVAVTVLDDRRDSIYSFLPARGFTTRLSTAELAAAFRANPPAVFVELSAAEQTAMARAREFRNPKELEWTFWISNGQPRLRPELDLVRRWKLKRWPDFGRLPHYHADVRMASALMAQALTLHELCDVAKARDETAINFLNATFTLGALAEDTAPETSGAAPAESDNKQEKKRKASGLSGLIGQLRRKFGLASAKAA
ncbi:MAG TPA: hypothetical protein VLW55_19480 [Burkholderiaceae bacterium]|nr:hypothetical protein [Burkholderiaceae bacterium]